MTTLVQLEYIVAVDNDRHFATAASKCFVTQPTLSMQIKKLEEYLGIIIFDRSKHPVIPTELGVQVIAQARITLAEAKKVNEVIDSYNNSYSGELSIGIIPSLAPYLIPLFIGEFTRSYPDVKVTVIELLTNEIIDQLNTDKIDVGIIVTPVDDPSLKTSVLFYEEMLLFANNNHKLAANKKIMTRQLSGPDLWLLNEGHCFRSQVLNLCSPNEKLINKFQFEYESGSLETIKKLVEIEGGYTLLPQLAIDKRKSAKTIVKKISGSPVREVSLAYTRSYTKKRLLEALEKSVKSCVPDELLTKSNGKIVEWQENK